MNIFSNGNRSNKYEIISIVKVVFDFSLNEIINNVISAISAIPIKNMIVGSASNKPKSNRSPNGRRIMDPFRNIKKYAIIAKVRIQVKLQ